MKYNKIKALNMNPTHFYTKYLENLSHIYPSAYIYKENISHCTSPFIPKLPLSTLNAMKKTVKNLFLWSRHHPSLNNHPEYSHIKNYSVLMSYDFQIDSHYQPKLIEINTNASGFLIGDLVQKTHGLKTSSLDKLKHSFFNEWALYKGDPQYKNPPKKTIITDENIEHQKMKMEFYMFHNLLNSWGWKNEILDVSEIQLSQNGRLLTPQKIEIDFIYNRTTDFYLKKWKKLEEAYLQQKICLSPQPKEYLVLSDKANLCYYYSQIHSPSILLDKNIDQNILKKTLIETILLKSREEAWKNKKQFFFKPIHGFGSRSVYRGLNLTKKKFEQLENCILQTYIPSFLWEDPIKQEKWKIDIRVFAYKDHIQLIVGRLYKGQLTNFKELLSGFCHIEFE